MGKNIDEIVRTKTELDGSERLVGRDGTGDFKTTVEDVLVDVKSDITDLQTDVTAIAPVKKIVELLILPGETPALTLDGGYALLNGQLISDAESTLFNGKRVPNAIGADVTLTLTFTADGSGAFATVPEADRMAIGIHDDVTGSGIAANTVVKSMDYSTGELIISDIAASGSIAVTFTNEGRSPKGSSVAGTVGNQMQRLEGDLPTILSVFGVGNGVFLDSARDAGAYSSYGASSAQTLALNFKNSNSPNARTTSTTNGKTTGDCFNVALYIKIK